MGTVATPLVIVNPASRGGRGASDWPRAAAALRAQFGGFERCFTEGPGHAAVVAEAEARAGRALLLTFGGDGTVSETARGILASESMCALGVIPHGTGGDFARSLGVPSRVADAARALRKGETRRIDVGRVRFDDGSSRCFVNAASFGLSAEVAKRVNASSKSKLSYAEQLLKAAFDFRFPRVELETELGLPERVFITTLSVHNGRFFGGGMEMAPGAELRDGKLQLVVVRKMSPLKLLSRAPLLYRGSHLQLEDVEHSEIVSLAARPANGDVIEVEVDGESVGQLPARFEVDAGALRVRMPG